MDIKHDPAAARQRLRSRVERSLLLLQGTISNESDVIDMAVHMEAVASTLEHYLTGIGVSRSSGKDMDLSDVLLCIKDPDVDASDVAECAEVLADLSKKASYKGELDPDEVWEAEDVRAELHKRLVDIVKRLAMREK